MVGSWWKAMQARREDAALRRRSIPDDLWKRNLIRYPFLQRRDPADSAELRRLTSLFLDQKEFNCTGGLRLSSAMAVAIASQAALPVLRLGLGPYEGFVGIVVHPDAVTRSMAHEDEHGVVHEEDVVQLGSAMQGGPVVLSWPHVRRAGHTSAQGLNVVIHEFVHVLQNAAGSVDAIPPLPAGLSRQAWLSTLSAEYETFCARIEREEPTVLDPYGASSPEEFLPVACEGFFINAVQMRAEHPALYAMLCRFFGQDPVVDQPARRNARA